MESQPQAVLEVIAPPPRRGKPGFRPRYPPQVYFSWLLVYQLTAHPAPGASVGGGGITADRCAGAGAPCSFSAWAEQYLICGKGRPIATPPCFRAIAKKHLGGDGSEVLYIFRGGLPPGKLYVWIPSLSVPVSYHRFRAVSTFFSKFFWGWVYLLGKFKKFRRFPAPWLAVAPGVSGFIVSGNPRPCPARPLMRR